MRVGNTVTINRPIEEVFEYASTPENDPTWVPASIRNRRTLRGPMRVGMTTEETVKLFGRTSRDTFEVVEYDSPTIVAYRATSGPLTGAVIRVRCQPVESGTSLRHTVEWEPRGLYYKAILPLMKWVGPRLLDNMDRTLKDLLEGEPTTPQPRPELTSGMIIMGVVAAMVVAVIIALVLLLGRRGHASRRWLRRLTPGVFS